MGDGPAHVSTVTPPRRHRSLRSSGRPIAPAAMRASSMIAGTPVSTRTPITISTAIAINSAKTGAEQHGKRENGQLRPRGKASHGVPPACTDPHDLASRRSATCPTASAWRGCNPGRFRARRRATRPRLRPRVTPKRATQEPADDLNDPQGEHGCKHNGRHDKPILRL